MKSSRGEAETKLNSGGKSGDGDGIGAKGRGQDPPAGIAPSVLLPGR